VGRRVLARIRELFGECATANDGHGRNDDPNGHRRHDGDDNDDGHRRHDDAAATVRTAERHVAVMRDRLPDDCTVVSDAAV
jgi:hypothetical protein